MSSSFSESTIRGAVYIDIIINFVFQRLEEDKVEVAEQDCVALLQQFYFELL
jgi:hypothetical protein